MQNRGIHNRPRQNVGEALKENYLPQLPLDLWHLVGIFVLMMFVMGGVVVVERKLPAPLKRASEGSHRGRFIAERAMDDLRNLTSIGPRVTGSYENEVLAVNFLINTVKEIKSKVALHHSIEIDVHRSSGAFPLTFLDGMINAYRNVQSVVVKLSSNMRTRHALLINCHFDTVPDSPGASDDGAGCVVMLEILRVISSSDRLLRHNIIFLFNGAEENIMQASHGFITQHKWASQVKAFVNLEACGAGGREVLFQAGPHSPWIVETYSEHVPYPYASSFAQEIFESGLIPGDTDFRIFRDFGKLSGLDFAWSANGYVYHTEFDSIEHIPAGTLQRTGDNILALAMGLVTGHHLADIQSEEGQPVFFDLLGALVVRFHMGVAGMISAVAIVLCAGHIYLNMTYVSRRVMLPRPIYLNQMRHAILVLWVSYATSVLLCVAVAHTLASLDRSMAWYARVVWLVPLYVVPAVATPAAIVPFATKKQRENPLLRGWVLTQIFADAQSVQWSVLVVVCAFLRIRSGFVPLLWVVCPSVAGLLRHAIMPYEKGWHRLIWYVLGVGLPFVQSCYLVLGCLDMFIPVTGRIGGGKPTEILTSLIVSMLVLFVTSCWVPLVLATRQPWRLLKLLYGIVLLSVGIIVLTPLGFPYSGDRHSPAPQRFMMMHMSRTIHDRSGDKVDSGYWLPDMDVHSPHTVDVYVPQMEYAKQVSKEECREMLYCGAPYYLPALSVISTSHWLKAPPPQAPDTLRAAFIHDHLEENKLRIHFNVSGPNHIVILFSPMQNSRVTYISLIDDEPMAGPMWGRRSTHFIYTAEALPRNSPWNFYVDIEHNHSYTPSHWLDVSITGYYLFGEYKIDEPTRELVNKFPPWATVTPWAGHLHIYHV